jgi:predicted 2-oxoglutarate/Fe(II)-dependent dioxygenase YbiX
LVGKTFTPIPNVVKIPHALPSDLCDRLVEHCRKSPDLVPGLVWNGKAFVINDKYRVVETMDVKEAVFPDLYEILGDVALQFNEQFKFSIHGVFDDALFMHYTAANVNHGDSFFNWHADIGEGYASLRKFSICIGLNDPSEYEGGDLLIRHGATENKIKLRKGEAVAFPAYISHCVTPITRGIRNSLVVFIVGPRFI